jgi:pyruvate, water dikinase
MTSLPRQDASILWFDALGIEDVPLVGGKNASLGEMYRGLRPRGIRIPNGFAITATAYHRFIREAGVDDRLKEILTGLDTRNIEDLQRRGRDARQAILNAALPTSLQAEILEAYELLSRESGIAFLDVAVRSSATAEDLPDASFAGQQETYLNVQGRAALLEAVKRCFASLYTDRAISYRVDKGFGEMCVGLSVCVQRMVRSDLASAGVMFSIDTETGFDQAVLINSSYGLGENVVAGSVNPDEFYVFKPTLKQGYRPILRKQLGGKEQKLIYDQGGGRMTRNIPVQVDDRQRFSLEDEDILTLARWAIEIEDYYSEKRGRPSPMDMEWGKDGVTGDLFILQARPETVHSRRDPNLMETFRWTDPRRPDPWVQGRSIGSRIAAGRVRIIHSVQELGQFQEGEVLVADRTDPDWEPSMKKAAAIVTNRGGRTCHAAIISRELGLPAVVGTENATKCLVDGAEVTVSCAEGDAGFVYKGILSFEVEKTALADIPRPQTHVMMNVGNPDEAFRLSRIPNDGVGLAREEFIITNTIKIHPKALLEYERLENQEVREAIDRLTVGYPDKPKFFVDRLAEGVAMIAAAFYPKDVIIRTSDFKTNEYANLLGGRAYEPMEENPMIGFRGASRYYDPRYRDAFALECQALKKVREEMGLTNLKIMIPFCRTPEEGRKVLGIMAENGLRQGEKGLEVYVMCEIPSNVILAGEFAEIFDGFSIGSNDLTQLILGVDRDSEVVAHLFDERNAAVMNSIEQVIKTVKSAGKKIGICGQAPSDYPEFAAFLVRCGIDSISLNPDVVLKTTLELAKSGPIH